MLVDASSTLENTVENVVDAVEGGELVVYGGREPIVVKGKNKLPRIAPGTTLTIAEKKKLGKGLTVAQKKKLIGTAAPSSKGIIFYDTAAGVRYLAQARVKGQKPKTKSFDTLEAATAWRKETEVSMGKTNGTPQAKRPGNMVMGGAIGVDGCKQDGLFATYVKEAKKDRGGIELPYDQLREFDRLMKHAVLKDVKVTDMSYRVAREFCRARKAEGVKPQTIQHEYARISVAIEKMADWCEWEGFHPLHGVRKRLKRSGMIAESVERVTRAKEHLPALLAYFSEREANPRANEIVMPMAAMVGIAALQGFRLSELLLRMEWEGLDIKHCTIRMWRKDSGGELQADGNHRRLCDVPLVPQVLEMLLSLQPDPAKRKGRVFPYNPATVQDRWEEAREAVGCPKLRIHDLRHEACTMLAMHLSGEKARQFSSHKTARSFGRYTNFQKEDHLQMATEAGAKIRLPE